MEQRQRARIAVVEVRLASHDDAAAIQAIYAPIVSETAVSFEVVPPTVEEMARRRRHDHPSHPWLVATDGDEVVSYAYAHAFAERDAYAWSIATSVYVHSDRRSQGIGRLLYGALLRLAELQGYRRAVAGVTLPNAASVGLHEALGFHPMGLYEKIGWKLGSWHDVLMLQRPLGSIAGEPQALETLDSLDPDTVVRCLKQHPPASKP